MYASMHLSVRRNLHHNLPHTICPIPGLFTALLRLIPSALHAARLLLWLPPSSSSAQSMPPSGVIGTRGAF
jgi:hypothetical protein